MKHMAFITMVHPTPRVCTISMGSTCPLVQNTIHSIEILWVTLYYDWNRSVTIYSKILYSSLCHIDVWFQDYKCCITLLFNDHLALKLFLYIVLLTIQHEKSSTSFHHSQFIQFSFFLRIISDWNNVSNEKIKSPTIEQF